jgi:hypothetical protein
LVVEIFEKISFDNGEILTSEEILVKAQTKLIWQGAIIL